jgi:hypothetical protein
VTDSLVQYAARYAIGRHTYASGEVADIVSKWVDKWSIRTRRTLIDDIETAFALHEVDELSTVAWEDALKKLKASQL